MTVIVQWRGYNKAVFEPLFQNSLETRFLLRLPPEFGQKQAFRAHTMRKVSGAKYFENSYEISCACYI